jgi:nucleoprotein TPR
LGQVVRLLLEVENQRAGGWGGTPGRTPSKALTPSGGMTTAHDVISEQLVEFGSIQELQLQNQKLLAVTRQLAQDQDDQMAEAKV